MKAEAWQGSKKPAVGGSSMRLQSKQLQIQLIIEDKSVPQSSTFRFGFGVGPHCRGKGVQPDGEEHPLERSSAGRSWLGNIEPSW